ncbi:MAG: Chromate transport protein ChrA [uncultured Rubrobacteraceae bacterium]|uniref:Chromate transport protein ChrA n=1 Tax=uncultured Rubrobacteraceae bacterium TaxID=349277 RepID=A0A6J4Q5Y2_9ACTN|nr:MAG: Chromate transport protein ChrA [uncultured Rubrobacteraceae bacterium]
MEKVKPVGFREAFWFWVKLGFINFGGPAGQIAIMHEELVERKRWVSEGQFLRTLNFCMLLPGPEAQQVATYIGWRLHGTLGGVVAGSFFVIPSIFVLLLLSYLSVAYSEVPAITGLLYGIQPVVIAIVVEAVLRIGKRTLHHAALVAFAVASFVAIYFLSVPFPLVVLGAALAGLLLLRWWPEIFRPSGHGGEDSEEEDPETSDEPSGGGRASVLRNLRLVGIFLVLWAVPVGAVWIWRGGEDVLFREALFFTGAAFVTIGGAYSVLSYVADVAVNTYGWLTTEQMVQGLGLAESTPGPLIMVTQYVGFLGAWNFSGPFSPLLYGTLGAAITTYVTFLPCFFFIFLLAPYIELLANNRRIQAALVGVTAAVVGVIANLAVFFASNVLFPNGFSVGGLDVFAFVVAVVSFVVLQRFKVPIYVMVPVGALAGMTWTLLA